jgi:hypothetical protein
VIEPLNVPEVVPSVVLLSEVVGVTEEVLQQIPDTVITDPPLEVIVPPEVAAYLVIPLAAVVLSVGATASVVKLISAP